MNTPKHIRLMKFLAGLSTALTLLSVVSSILCALLFANAFTEFGKSEFLLIIKRVLISYQMLALASTLAISYGVYRWRKKLLEKKASFY